MYLLGVHEFFFQYICFTYSSIQYFLLLRWHGSRLLTHVAHFLFQLSHAFHHSRKLCREKEKWQESWSVGTYIPAYSSQHSNWNSWNQWAFWVFSCHTDHGGKPKTYLAQNKVKCFDPPCTCWCYSCVNLDDFLLSRFLIHRFIIHRDEVLMLGSFSSRDLWGLFFQKVRT